ncbi:MAG TPA: hypothetical protein VNB49_15370, partial [Candidatus Dormibacteraeota bacterium]|nr:hypothetical protein [Candidatus Dormibacteraeota bacterium]
MQNGETTRTKEGTYSDRRHKNWSPRKEIPTVVEGGEERDAETPVGHRIKQAVTRGGKKEIQPQRMRMHPGEPMPESEHDDDEGQEGGENERVREASVPPKVPIPDSEAKPNHIKVRYNGTHCSDHPSTFWNLRLVEA